MIATLSAFHPSHRILKRLLGRSITWLVFSVVLSGCTAGLNSEFGCSAVGGQGGCTSMTAIHQQVDQGELRTDQYGNVITTPAPLVAAPVVIDTATFDDAATVESEGTGVVIDAMDSVMPARQPEKIAKIVIFPFEDAQANYHATSVLYAVIESSRWKDRWQVEVVSGGQDD
jgi:conjugal transfer pilus assembly protein TraV